MIGLRPNLSLLFGSFVLAVSMVSADASPSFNCARASSADEVTICSDEKLSAVDFLIAEAYRSYRPEFQPKKSIARMLLADRRACGDDAVCIIAAQLSALTTYGEVEPWVQNLAVSEVSARASYLARKATKEVSRMPQRSGDCVKTKISTVTTRFGEPVTDLNTDEGTSVEYDNGGRVVSYGRDQGLSGAKAGHRVVMCLLTIPYDCPDGDDRGRLYYTLDIDTKGEWILTDTQHMCGGA